MGPPPSYRPAVVTLPVIRCQFAPDQQRRLGHGGDTSHNDQSKQRIEGLRLARVHAAVGEAETEREVEVSRQVKQCVRRRGTACSNEHVARGQTEVVMYSAASENTGDSDGHSPCHSSSHTTDDWKFHAMPKQGRQGCWANSSTSSRDDCLFQ
ncbi:hypothetical protein H310_12596 [Aphanomyces invadans]|uniref:Uncharacterized protein n=1 Tax=Aphanomyces invadans TaxID=157072 RepID=A0A024TGX6_9STRA|nr:hypothetical protein H310_12596 [Aphanomyces invadans]ETV93308.1 hypothetical protein H310_12596 [Aphanomyces invadans]|eukprot:XP_008877944.1 hypothetical protein H310_12596 [Aphanomyces invadans]